MAIRFQCACGRALRVQDAFAGKRVKCPGCRAVAKVPLRSNKPKPKRSDADSEKPVQTPLQSSLHDEEIFQLSELIYEEPEDLDEDELEDGEEDADYWWWDENTIYYIWEKLLLLLVAIGILAITVFFFQKAYAAPASVDGVYLAFGGLGVFTLLGLSGAGVWMALPEPYKSRTKVYLHYIPDVVAVVSSWSAQGIMFFASDAGSNQAWGWATSISLASTATWIFSLGLRSEGDELNGYDFVDLVLGTIPMIGALMAAYFSENGVVRPDIAESLTNANRVEITVQVILTAIVIWGIVSTWPVAGKDSASE